MTTQTDFEKQIKSINQIRNQSIKKINKESNKTEFKYVQSFYKNNVLPKLDISHSVESKGEESIKQYLKTHNIPYTSPFVPNTCKDKNPLHFDFKINNILIEFQRIQHYKPIDHFGGVKYFKTQIRHDEIKRTWAKNNNYTEIEIKYNDNINNILDSIFNKKYIE